MSANPRRLLFACLLFGAALVPPRGRGDEVKPPPISEIVRDGDGEIWGIDPRTSGGLYRYADGRWLAAPVHGLDERKCRAIALVRRADGAVVCLWGGVEKERFFSVQRGRQAPPSEPVALVHPDPGPGFSCLLADAKNNVWLTNSSPYICRLSPDGIAACVRTLSPEEGFLPGQASGTGPARVDGWDQVLSCEDAQGRVWFHSQGFYSRHLHLRGLLVHDGENFTLREPLPAANRHLGLLAPKDAGHLWLGVVYDGLYVLDTATFQLERVPGQPDEARGLSEVFPRGKDDWIFVLHGFGSNSRHSLWSLRGDHWEKLVGSLDSDTLSWSASRRVWARTGDGYYLGSGGNGLWFVPDAGPTRSLDWQAGFPVTSPTGLVPLSAPGRWLCADNNARVWTGPLDEIAARAGTEGSHRFEFVQTTQPLVPDERRHLWGLLAADYATLAEWDGARWINHALPADGLVSGGYRRPMGVDGTGRVWLTVSGTDRKMVLIYAPAKDHWERYDDFEDALEAQAAVGKAAELPVSEYPDDLARFGPNGQICYLDAGTTLGWFDGARWRHWKRGEIHGADSRWRFDGPPFFTASGTLAVNVHKETWEFADGNDWKKSATYQPGYADDEVRYAFTRRGDLPASAVTRTPESMTVDNEGSYWLTWEKGLYRCRAGLCVTVLRPDEAQPFIDGRRLTGALIDVKGNAFLRCPDRREYVVLHPPGPLPRTSVELAAAGARPDTRSVNVNTDAAAVDGKVHLEWRLDGGGWQALTIEKGPATVALDALRNGAHRFEARSFDASLQTDATPAAVDFRVDFDPQAQVAGYIAQLADPDEGRRKEAVFALAHQPDLALPALRAARAKTSDENQRWWIDAAMQQIGTAKPL